MRGSFRIGEKVVYTRDKYSTSPGPRAKNVLASRHGETYEYQVDKYWIVGDVRNDGRIVLKTRRGKQHVVEVDDPRLRRASLIERLFKGKLFPQPDSQESGYLPAAFK